MDWLIVSRQLYFTINLEEILCFLQEKMPYLCGFWRFANAYYIPGGEEIKLLQFDGIDYSLPDYKMFFSVLVDNCRRFEDENKLVTEMMLQCINGESPRKVVYNHRHCFINGTASVKILGDALEKLEATIRRPQYYGHTKNEFMRLTGGITK